MANEVNLRNQRDALLTITKALPAADAANATDSFDLGEGPHNEGRTIEVTIPTLPALVDDKTVTLELEHSDDDSSFTDVGDYVFDNDDSTTFAGSYSFVVTGTETPGTPGPVTFRVPIPPFTKRYVRFSQAVLAAGGDNTGVSITYTLLQ